MFKFFCIIVAVDAVVIEVNGDSSSIIATVIVIVVVIIVIVVVFVIVDGYCFYCC